MRINRKKQFGKHAVISGIRMPQLRCTRVSESDILRRASLALCACLLFTAVFVGCGTEASDEPVDPNRLQVMASFYTMYDFAQKIGGEHVQVTCMVPSGTEPHDWEPSTKDITRMEQADVFIYNGAGMEHWVSDVLAGLSNKKMISVEASQGVSLLRSAVMTMRLCMPMRTKRRATSTMTRMQKTPRMKTMPPTTLLSPHRTVMTAMSTASTTPTFGWTR